jgi:hypothetical protein
VRAKIPPLHHTAEGIVPKLELTEAGATQNVALWVGKSFQLKGDGLFAAGRTKSHKFVFVLHFAVEPQSASVVHAQFRPPLVPDPVASDVAGHASVPASAPHWQAPVVASIVEDAARHVSLALTTQTDLSAPPPPAIQIV